MKRKDMTREEKQLYWIWADMKSRCICPTHKQFKNYGGRGLTVADEWQSFDRFLSDVSPRPEGLSLDRTDNGKGYGPDNFRWADRKTQNSNRRNCIKVQCDGETVTLREYCRRKGLPYRPIIKRIKYRGWTMQEALTIPIGGRIFDTAGNRIEAAA